MKSRSSLLNLVVILLALSPLAFLGIIWSQLPEMVPIHYDVHFKPDKMDHKIMLWLVTGILSLVSILVYTLLVNLHKIDPKRKNQLPSPSFKRLAIVVALFITVLNFILLMSVANYITFSLQLLLVSMGLLITLLGNYMSTIKPNYFAGLRLPWTLSSDYNWKKTHQFAGKLWFCGGLILILLAFIITPAYSLYTFFSLLGLMVIIPVIYSYRLFKQENYPASKS